jgi:Na+-transporting NADH:ubiquinone oxidoreductase subunit NqrB
VKSVGVVSFYWDKYARFDKVLSAIPEIIRLVHVDISVLSQSQHQGQESNFITEILFCAILVMKIEGLSFCETTIRIADSETFQKFCHLFKKKTIDYRSCASEKGPLVCK